MSGDTVERLREYAHIVQSDRYDDGELLEEAADEIVRLRAERDASRLMISDLTAEAERLRAERDAYRQAVDALAAWEEARRG